MFVLAPDLKEDQRATAKGKIIEDLTGLGAEIEKEEDWGKRDLAFEVKDFHQGFYHLVQFKAMPEMPKKLKRLLKVNEKVIRYLLTKREIVAKAVKAEVAPEAGKAEIKEELESSAEAAGSVADIAEKKDQTD
jgi:small subunit ribosomal protein S6